MERKRAPFEREKEGDAPGAERDKTPEGCFGPATTTNPIMYIRYRVYIPNNKGILVASLTRPTSGNRATDFAADVTGTEK